MAPLVAELAPVLDLEAADDRLREAVAIRVDAHRRHARGESTIDQYLAALRWVRGVEDELEPIRRRAGFACSRAFELCTAHTADYYRPPEDHQLGGHHRHAA